MQLLKNLKRQKMKEVKITIPDNCPIEACVQMIEELYKRELI